MYIITRGGLCNQLRTLFAYNFICKKNKKKLYVKWTKDKKCIGFFLDYFKPINNVIFTNNKPPNLKLSYRGGYGHPGLQKRKDLNLYKELKLKDDLIKIINEKRKLLNDDYIAVHIRRTDFFPKYKKIYNDNYFMKFIDNFKNKNLYIATDNKDTYNKFLNKYKDIVKFKFEERKNIRKKLRHTTLKNSIIDLFMCVFAKNFIGTPYSSFTTLIYKLRRFNYK